MPYLAFTQTASKTIADSVAETTLLGTGIGTLTFPANFWYVGRIVLLELHGEIADTGTPTARLKVKMGATTLIDSTAVTLPALTSIEEWQCEVLVVCRSIGATGSLQTSTDFMYETTTGSSPVYELNIPGTTTVFDTTAAGAIDITFQWGTQSASNTIASEIVLLEVLN